MYDSGLYFPKMLTKREISVGNNTRKLNKICSSNLYPFSPESIVEHILATTNESRLGDKVSIFSHHFLDCIYRVANVRHSHVTSVI